MLSIRRNPQTVSFLGDCDENRRWTLNHMTPSMKRSGRMGGTVHRTTINFSDSLWTAINRCRGDVSASAYIREAVLARIFYERWVLRDADIEDGLKKAKQALKDEA